MVSETSTTIVESHRIQEDTAAHKPGEDARFLEAVSSRFEGPQVKIEQRVSSNDGMCLILLYNIKQFN